MLVQRETAAEGCQRTEGAGPLLAIERALQRLYPDDRVMRDYWISFRNEKLGPLTGGDHAPCQRIRNPCGYFWSHGR